MPPLPLLLHPPSLTATTVIAAAAAAVEAAVVVAAALLSYRRMASYEVRDELSLEGLSRCSLSSTTNRNS